MASKITGVYMIACRATGMFYIGGSVNIRGRLMEHRGRLRHGGHGILHMQTDWLTYGEDSFYTSYAVEPGYLNIERELLELLMPLGVLYNRSAVVMPVTPKYAKLSEREHRMLCLAQRGNIG